MNPIPHITKEQAVAIDSLDPNYWYEVVNERIDKANAEQEQPLISAEEARKLGAGKAEWSYNGSQWDICCAECEYRDTFNGGLTTFKYRAIKQPKQVSWSSVPVGVAVYSKSNSTTFTFLGLAREPLKEPMARLFKETSNTIGLGVSGLKLASASEQPWIAVQATFEKVEGLVYETKADAGYGTSPRDIAAFKITGLAEGYELK